jgi:hypothetical protein
MGAAGDGVTRQNSRHLATRESYPQAMAAVASRHNGRVRAQQLAGGFGSGLGAQALDGLHDGRVLE